MKVLVTGFKPFNNNYNNYSSEVLQFINNVDKLIIDVKYNQCYLEIMRQVDLEKYDLIIALGEARKRKVLTLEKLAKNIMDCSLADNSGQIKKNQLISDHGPNEIMTKVNLNGMEDLVEFSHDAGKFVCNNLYYHLLLNHGHKALFIHVPECDNNIDNYLKYAKTIEQIIKKIGENR